MHSLPPIPHGVLGRVRRRPTAVAHALVWGRNHQSRQHCRGGLGPAGGDARHQAWGKEHRPGSSQHPGRSHCCPACRVFACFTPPFDPDEIANLARSAASDRQWRDDVQVLSAKPGWVSVRVNCRLITAERLMTFAKELSAQLPEGTREEMMQALREILLNAMEHGAAFNPEQVVEVTAVRTGRAMVFYVRDPGAGFRRESLTHAAIANPADDPAAHIVQREAEGMRPGGYGLLLAGGTVDELIYNEIGNEVLLVKYVDSASGRQ